MKKVAILGRASGWNDAPFSDPSWEIWSLNYIYKIIRKLPNGRWDRWFDIHEKTRKDQQHRQELAKMNCPVYVTQQWDIPNAVLYPMEEIKREFFANVNREQFFTSSIPYMIALALYEGFDEISLYGINQATKTEYEKHIQCTAFWLGIALGRGVRVEVQKHSSLLNPETLYQ